MKIEWDYKINMSKLHEDYMDSEITFEEYVVGIVDKVEKLKNRVTDNTLKTELQNWIDDMGQYYNGKFEHILDDGDEDELEFRLDELYDIGDVGKRIWFGGM